MPPKKGKKHGVKKGKVAADVTEVKHLCGMVLPDSENCKLKFSGFCRLVINFWNLEKYEMLTIIGTDV